MNRFEQFRQKRLKVYEGLFSARALCITGLLIMPAMLFAPSVVRISQFLFFCLVAWLCGKKSRPLITLTVMLFIVAFNLIVPHGQVLFSIGAFRITSGALWVGIHRAVTLAGLIMLSRAMIRQDLKIPGLFGELIGESFRIFSIIMNQRHRITRKNLISDIDQMMVDLSNDSGEAAPQAAPASRTKPLGFVVLILAVLFSWFLWFFTFWFVRWVIMPLWMHFAL